MKEGRKILSGSDDTDPTVIAGSTTGEERYILDRLQSETSRLSRLSFQIKLALSEINDEKVRLITIPSWMSTPNLLLITYL